MAKKKLALADLRELRKSVGENQSVFWARFGVSQSGGSRYENSRNMDVPLRMLMQAWLDGTFDDAALAKLRARVGAK